MGWDIQGILNPDLTSFHPLGCTIYPGQSDRALEQKFFDPLLSFLDSSCQIALLFWRQKWNLTDFSKIELPTRVESAETRFRHHLVTPVALWIFVSTRVSLFLLVDLEPLLLKLAKVLSVAKLLAFVHVHLCSFWRPSSLARYVSVARILRG
jgi:hypothetical protein